jgi:imidazole glycerol-phosphate synthase subunit HisF
MLKKRIIAVLILKNNRVVQSIGFKQFLPVGYLETSVEYLNKWGVDEIIILDIDATKKNKKPNFTLIEKASKYSQTPLCVGGGVSTLEDMELLLNSGADKIALNTPLFSNQKLIERASTRYGSQCIVASIDVKKYGSEYKVFNENIKEIDMDINTALNVAQDAGAGEVFINSVDKDGKKTGYDLQLASKICNVVNIPIILCGGVGKPSHLVDGLSQGMDAVAAGNFFHFTEMSVIITKKFLIQNNCSIRLDGNVKFENTTFDERLNRPMKKSEILLDKMRFKNLNGEQF